MISTPHRLSPYRVGGALAAALLLAPLLAASLTSSCSSDVALEECLADEGRGVFAYSKNDACGCDKNKCDVGTKCFQHDCCDPALEQKNPQKCGCERECQPREICTEGLCCDPFTADSESDCGCNGPCDARQTCAPDEEGRYQCTCDPEFSLGDADDCGCQGPCDSDWERCRNGKCECDPLSGANRQNDEDCGCRGPCPFTQDGPDAPRVFTSYCYDGVCHCIDADQVECDGACVNEQECLCDPQKHESDVTNCACQGSCAVGEACLAGGCQCDSISHATDDLNCSCQGPCDTAHGYTCIQGTCDCPPEKLSDDTNCGCQGPCDTAHGYTCIQGTCDCPPENLSNNMNCGCQGPCDTANGYACVQGTCACPAENLNNSLNCGCAGPCLTASVGYDWICGNASCQCPSGSHLCNPPGNLSGSIPSNHDICWPDLPGGGLSVMCADCKTTCAPPSLCKNHYDDPNDPNLITSIGCYQP